MSMSTCCFLDIASGKKLAAYGLPAGAAEAGAGGEAESASGRAGGAGEPVYGAGGGSFPPQAVAFTNAAAESEPSISCEPPRPRLLGEGLEGENAPQNARGAEDAGRGCVGRRAAVRRLRLSRLVLRSRRTRTNSVLGGPGRRHLGRRARPRLPLTPRAAAPPPCRSRTPISHVGRRRPGSRRAGSDHSDSAGHRGSAAGTPSGLPDRLRYLDRYHWQPSGSEECFRVVMIGSCTCLSPR